jgi:hypothetical protein
MRYRQLSPTGDYTFGQGQLNFLINSPEAVAQVVETSLKLWLGEWYLDVTQGMPYPEGVLGKHSQLQADQTIVAYIEGLTGVQDIENYQSNLNPNTRAYESISGTLNTIYGPTPIQIEFAGDF